MLLVIALLLILLLGLHSAGFRVQGLGMFGIIAVLGCLFCACIPTFWGGGSKMWDIELAEPSESLHTWSQAFQQPSKTPNRPMKKRKFNTDIEGATKARTTPELKAATPQFPKRGGVQGSALL